MFNLKRQDHLKERIARSGSRAPCKKKYQESGLVGSSCFFTIYYVLCTIFYKLYILCTTYYILYTTYYILHTIYCILHTIYRMLYTIYCMSYTLYLKCGLWGPLAIRFLCRAWSLRSTLRSPRAEKRGPRKPQPWN